MVEIHLKPKSFTKTKVMTNEQRGVLIRIIDHRSDAQACGFYVWRHWRTERGGCEVDVCCRRRVRTLEMHKGRRWDQLMAFKRQREQHPRQWRGEETLLLDTSDLNCAHKLWIISVCVCVCVSFIDIICRIFLMVISRNLSRSSLMTW